MRKIRILVAAVPLLAACSGGAEPSPSERFKKGGAGRAEAWEELRPRFLEALSSIPKTKAEIAGVTEKFLGKSEPAAVTACQMLVVWAGSPQPMDEDVFAYLLSRDEDGFRRYIVADFRDPAKPDIREAST